MTGTGGNEVVPLLLAVFISAVKLYGSADNSCKPTITYPRLNLNLTLGSTLLLNCTVQACPGDSDSLKVEWGKKLSGQYYPINDSLLTASYQWRKEDKLKEVTLRIQALMPEDEGQYQCLASQSEVQAIGHIIIVHLRNATETNISQAGIDNPPLGPVTQLSNPLLIVASILGTVLLLVLLGSSLWRFYFKDLLRARTSARLRILQSDSHYDEVKKEEEVTYTTVTVSPRPWPAAFVQTSDTQSSCEYAILRYQPPPTTKDNSNHHSSV